MSYLVENLATFLDNVSNDFQEILGSFWESKKFRTDKYD